MNNIMNKLGANIKAAEYSAAYEAEVKCSALVSVVSSLHRAIDNVVVNTNVLGRLDNIIDKLQTPKPINKADSNLGSLGCSPSNGIIADVTSASGSLIDFNDALISRLCILEDLI